MPDRWRKPCRPPIPKHVRMPWIKEGKSEVLLRAGSNKPQWNERPPVGICHFGCHLRRWNRKMNSTNPVLGDSRHFYLQLCVRPPDSHNTRCSSLDGASEDEISQRRGWDHDDPRRPKRSPEAPRSSRRGEYTARGDGTTMTFRRTRKLAKPSTSYSPRLRHWTGEKDFLYNHSIKCFLPFF